MKTMFLKNVFINKLLRKEGIRYVIVGGANTVTGYFIGVTFLFVLKSYLPTYIIGTISTIVGIVLNLILYRTFVFGSSGKWFSELLRMLQVYAFSSVVGITTLTVAIDIFELSIWWGQLCALVTGASISALANYTYSFKRKIPFIRKIF